MRADRCCNYRPVFAPSRAACSMLSLPCVHSPFVCNCGHIRALIIIVYAFLPFCVVEQDISHTPLALFIVKVMGPFIHEFMRGFRLLQFAMFRKMRLIEQFRRLKAQGWRDLW